ncbi:MAG: proline dehydrogenase family protein [Gemmatimonadetes bacterium]|nr:proline dehydrogenase family protein [Gemmatimonadota bacterium]
MALARKVLLWASTNRWLAHRFPRYRFAQAAVRRFMPGTTAEAALEATRQRDPAIVGSILTRLGENLTTLDEAAAVVDHYLHVSEMIRETGLPAQISIKLTQLGLDISETAALDHARRLARCLDASGNTLWIDMEDSSYVDRTLHVFETLLEQHGNVGLCLQAYLYRTEADLDRLLEKTVAIRLVKGAYHEPPDAAYPRKRDVDEAFFRLGRKLLAATRDIPDGPRPGLGTHDIDLVRLLAATAETDEVTRDAYEIQMLYGIASGAQVRLAKEGHRVRILISYGEEWFPWYVRRLAERPANVWFVVKNMFGG